MLIVYKAKSSDKIRKGESMITVEKKAISNQVLAYLRREIMLNKLPEGYHMKESEIADRLKISRGPVREALTQLEKEKLVKKLLNGRTVVEKFEQKDIENIYNARILLEKAALAETKEEVFIRYSDKFDYYLELMNDTDEKNEADLAFHELIIKMSGNKALQQLWSSLNGIALTLMEITNEYLSMRQQEAIHEHEEVIDKLKQGKLSEAQDALESHLKGAAVHYMDAVNEITLGGEYLNDN